jgi:hypothetical protein
MFLGAKTSLAREQGRSTIYRSFVDLTKRTIVQNSTENVFFFVKYVWRVHDGALGPSVGPDK